MKHIKILDVAAFFIVLSIIGVFSYFTYSTPQDNAEIKITTEDSEWVYPVDTNETFHFHGPIGDTVVEIKNEEVRVLSSPCTEKICIASSPIKRPGSWLACLPNRVFIRIEGTDEEKIDAETF